jgi:NitT/TauT family transport system ATP-binding protein
MEEIALDFTRPRQAELVTSGDFTRLKRYCLELLHQPGTDFPLRRLSPLGAMP